MTVTGCARKNVVMHHDPPSSVLRARLEPCIGITGTRREACNGKWWEVALRAVDHHFLNGALVHFAVTVRPAHLLQGAYWFQPALIVRLLAVLLVALTIKSLAQVLLIVMGIAYTSSTLTWNASLGYAVSHVLDQITRSVAEYDDWEEFIERTLRVTACVVGMYFARSRGPAFRWVARRFARWWTTHGFA